MNYIFFIFIIIVILFILYEIYELNTLSVSKYEINSDKIQSEFNNYKIVQISDLHSKSFGKNNIKLINRINKLNPDVIFMTGDIIDKRDINHDIALKFLKDICSKYKVFYVLGNHEIEIGYKKLREYKKELKKLGVVILENSSVKLEKGKSHIFVNGLSFRCNLNDKKTSYIKFINKKIGKFDKKFFNVLLVHDPTHAKLLDKFENDLILCGHLHGGIIRILNTGFFSPARNFFPKYFAGLYELNNSKLIVSRGLGKSKAIIRINNLPDIVFITLKSDEK